MTKEKNRDRNQTMRISEFFIMAAFGVLLTYL